MTYAQIVSTGICLPEIEVTNDMLRARFNGSAPELVDKMEGSSAIRTRWYAPAEWATSDLAQRAAEQALARAGRSASEIDLIILGTDSPDYITPATSVVLQAKLGAKNAAPFAVGCACASFPTAISSAAGLMATNPSLKSVLVVGVYLMHKLADANDPMIFFYGDGVGAAVREGREEPGCVAAAFAAAGWYAKNWLIPAGGTVEPATAAACEGGRLSVTLVERYPPEINNLGWPKLVRACAKNGGFAVGDIDFLIFTQVRRPTIELVMEDLGLPMERTHMGMGKWGYTGSARLQMALDDAFAEQKVNPGDLVVMIGSGVGYNQAARALPMPRQGARRFV